MAIPATPLCGRFIIGKVYFIVLYADEALAIPVVQTLIFLEDRRREDGGAEYRFREIKPHEEESLFTVQEECLDELIVDRIGLIERLGESRP